MAENLPLAIPMEISRKIAERAEASFRAELRNVVYAWTDYTVERLEHELALAMYRVAMKRLGDEPGRAQGAPERGWAIVDGGYETSSYTPPRPVVTGCEQPDGDATEEHEALAEGSGPTNGVKGE